MKKTAEKRQTGFFVKLAIFAFAVFAVISIVQLQFRYNEYKLQRDQLKAEISQLEDKRDELQSDLDAPADRDHIIAVAKEKLNLRLPEEIIFYNDLYN